MAAPKRTDEAAGVTYNSALKPIGETFRSASINLGNDQIQQVEIGPATEAEIEATRKVMGRGGFRRLGGGAARRRCAGEGMPGGRLQLHRAGATMPITARARSAKPRRISKRRPRRCGADPLRERIGGAAYVSINKALVTQASAAIPVVPLYISALYKVMKEKGTHEGDGGADCGAPVPRPLRARARTPATDAAGRIRIDDSEMAPDVQARVSEMWKTVTSDNLMSAIDYAGFKHDFRVLFGFEVPGVDYSVPVETEVAIAE